MTAPEEVDVWIGLDVGKESHYATVLDDHGDKLTARSLGNDEADLDALIDSGEEHGKPALVIDQPGSIAQLALAVAQRRGVPVAYVPGLVMRRAADLYPGEAKTDPIDSYVLADTARTRRKQVQWLDVTDEILEQLQILNGFDIDLAADVTRVASRLRDALTSVSPALERAVGSRLSHGGVRVLLAKHPTPIALQKAGRTRVAKLVKTRSPRLGDKVADAVFVALEAQTVTVAAEVTIGRVIAELAGELDRLHERREVLAKEIEEVFLAHPLGPVLVSLPGIGTRTGARILAEIGEGSRFSSGAKLASYAGLAPVLRQSGTSLKSVSRSRRGNHRLKNALFLAAFAAIRTGESKMFYDRKRAEGKRHNAAVICLARRRCDVILAMLRTSSEYLDPTLEESTKAA